MSARRPEEFKQRSFAFTMKELENWQNLKCVTCYNGQDSQSGLYKGIIVRKKQSSSSFSCIGWRPVEFEDRTGRPKEFKDRTQRPVTLVREPILAFWFGCPRGMFYGFRILRSFEIRKCKSDSHELPSPGEIRFSNSGDINFKYAYLWSLLVKLQVLYQFSTQN